MATTGTDRDRPGLLRTRLDAAWVLALALAAPLGHAYAGSDALEIVGSARTTHLEASLTVRPGARQARLSEIRVRSGSLALYLEAVEIVFADGGTDRAILRQNLPPGHQSRAIKVDGSRPVRKILITKRPGMRQGATTLQLLGKVIRE